MQISRARIGEIVRYYQAGVVNTLFGFGVYALLVRLGLNIYAAQICAHVLGVGFNYFSYSRHVFRDAAPAKMRFLISYGANYLVSLATLALASLVIRNPYAAGLASIVLTSIINYFALRHFVFLRAPSS